MIWDTEEEEHQEKGATKVLKKVKEKAKKIKNSLTKHGHDNDDVDEEDDNYDEQAPEVHGAPGFAPFLPKELAVIFCDINGLSVFFFKQCMNHLL